MTPFNGVRISWLIMARKADFAVLAASAAATAFCASSMRLSATFLLPASSSARAAIEASIL